MRGHVTAPPFPSSDRTADVRTGCKTQRIALTLRHLAVRSHQRKRVFQNMYCWTSIVLLPGGPTLGRLEAQLEDRAGTTLRAKQHRISAVLAQCATRTRLNGKFEGKRNKGRQKEKIMDGLTTWLGPGKVSHILAAVKDRDLWRNMITNAYKQGTR
ncbi:hypothetical protein PoB_007395200 [Plakobranchus ocellatus]|uniref:Uncharacterized protein n=1 Tax=Plakobranchus ocellatus TaxID=259542 RepID=A0AAV4DSZ8_9GAST|nr:hypothetical protein PoB_007395200 [Plakobranchus ocellatus]